MQRFASNFRAIATALIVTSVIVCPVRSQDLAGQIVGVWKLTSFVRTEVATGQSTKPFGEEPKGHTVFSAGGHAVYFLVAEKRARPAGALPTSIESAELFKTMTGASGTYRLAGSKLSFRSSASWNEVWTGVEQAYDVKISGPVLTITSGPLRSPIDDKEIVGVSTYERLE